MCKPTNKYYTNIFLYHLSYILLELRKSKKINSFWTTNGKILAKVTPESTVVTLNIADDIAQKLGVDTNV